MRLFYDWVPRYCYPPLWMAFAYYSAERNKMLFVAYPFHYLVWVAWWLQDKWAYHARATSWIENEIEQRMRDSRNSRHNS